MFTRAFFIAAFLTALLVSAPVRADEPAVSSAAPESAASESLQRTKRSLAGEATPGQSGASAKAVSTMMCALAVLGGLAAFAKRFQQRQAKLGNGLSIDLLAKRQLSPKHALFVVEIEGQRLVLGTGGERMQLLTTLDSFADTFRFSESEDAPDFAPRVATPKVAVG